MKLTLERLKEVFSYDPESGIFTHSLSGPGRPSVGTVAGHIDQRHGYRVMMIDRKMYYAQRLAWFWVHGVWPRLLRFQNDDHSDCRIANLVDGKWLSTKHDWKTKEGKAAAQKEYREVRRDVLAQKERERTFGLSLADYSALVAAQDNKCAICNCAETATRNGRVKALAVDHDHATGKIRGLLCVACNTGIGKFKDDRNLMLAAVKYLDKHSNVERVAAKLEIVRNEA